MRLPGVVRRGTTVEVSVLVTARAGISTYETSAIDFSIAGRGLRNPRLTPIGGETTVLGFLGEGGTILARGRDSGPGSRLGFTARFDVAPDAPVDALHFQVHASVTGPAGSRAFIRNYVADVKP